MITVHYNPSAEQTQGEVFVHATESGEQMVTVTGAVKHKPLDVSVDVVATQDGTPDPINPIPIKGTELVEVGHTGTNLLPLKIHSTGYATVTPIANGLRLTATSSGTNHAQANISIPDPQNLVGKTITLRAIGAITGTGNYYITCFWANNNGGGSGVTAIPDMSVSGAPMTRVNVPPSPDITLFPLLIVRIYLTNPTVGSYIDYTEMQLELGNTATPYTPHQSHTATYAPDKPLNGLPGAPDTVDFGAGVETRKTKRNTYTGAADENWGMYTAANGTYFTIALPDRCYFDNDFTQMRCTMAPTGAPPKLPCAYITSTGKTLVIYPGVASLDSVDAFRALLASSPMDVVYQLATPITTPINVNTIPAYGGTEHVWCEEAAAVRVGYDMTNQAAYDKLVAMMAGGAT